MSTLLAGFVGALAGLAIALLAQSREDLRIRQAEEWRQQVARQDRLRAEFVSALKVIYAIEAFTAPAHWVTPSFALQDEGYIERLEELDAAYKEAKAADVRLRLEGAEAVWKAVDTVVVEHQKFKSALQEFEEPGPRSPILKKLEAAHKAIGEVAETAHAVFGGELEALTPPGPSEPSGLRVLLRAAWRWLTH